MITTFLCTVAILVLVGPALAAAPWFIYKILN